LGQANCRNLGIPLGKSIKNFKKAMDDPDGKIDAESAAKKVETEPEIKKNR